MKVHFQDVIEKFSFLSPYYTGQLDIAIAYLKEQNLLLDFTISANTPSYTAEGITKNIHLQKHVYPEHYIRYEFAESLLKQFYQLVDIKATKYDLNDIGIENLDNYACAADKLINRIIAILSSYKRYDNFNTIIVSPSILSYFYQLQHFRPDRSDRYSSRNFNFNRFAIVGSLFNRMNVYVDNEKREDFILMGTFDSDTIRLYYSWNNCTHNQINFTIEDVCYNFEDKFIIFKDIKFKDPMETDVTNFDSDTFFYSNKKIATN